MKAPTEADTRTDKATSGPRYRLSSKTLVPALGYLLAILLMLLSRNINPSFGSLKEAETILLLASFLIIVAFGQGLVVLLGELDLSISSVITLSGVLLAGWLNGSNSGLWWALPADLAICMGVGVISGLLVTVLNIPSFIATLAVQAIVYGIVLGFTNGTALGLSPSLLTRLFSGHFLGLPPAIYLILVAGIVGVAIQGWTPFGRRAYAVGSNRLAAHVSGLATKRIIITAYAISGACAAIVGLMLLGYSDGASLTMGDSYLLPSIAAVVIGGTAVSGGKGNYIGTIGGAILLTTVSTIITAMGLAEGWKTFINGAIIVLVAIILREQWYPILADAYNRLAGGGMRRTDT